MPDPAEETQKAPLDPGKETREIPSGRKEKIREAPSDPEEETLEAPSDPNEKAQEAPLDPEKTQKAPPNPEGKTREAPSDPGVETKYVAGLAAESTDLEGLVVPARWKLTIKDNLPPNDIIAHVESAGARRRGRSSAAKYSADDRRSRREGRRVEYVDIRLRGLDDSAEKGGGTGADVERHVTGVVNRQKTMNALEMEEWRKVQRKKKLKVARKLVVGARMIYNRNMKDCEIEKYRYRFTA